MDLLQIVIPVSLLLLTAGGLLFWWTVKHGQYDDLDSPAHRILFDDDEDMLPDDIKPKQDNSSAAPQSPAPPHEKENGQQHD